MNLTLNFGNQNSVGYYTKNIQKGGKISFAIEFVYYVYIFINDYNILAIMMMMDDDIKEKQYQQEQRLFTFIIAYVVLIYIVISVS